MTLTYHEIALPSNPGDQDQLGFSRNVKSSFVSSLSGLLNGFSLSCSVFLLVLLSLGNEVSSSLLEVGSSLLSSLGALLTQLLITSVFTGNVFRNLLLLLHLFLFEKKTNLD